jgi:hypothetical protein
MNTSVFVETEKHENFSLPTIVYDIILLSLLIIIDMTCTFAGIWFICMEGGLISCKKKSQQRERLWLKGLIWFLRIVTSVFTRSGREVIQPQLMLM